MAVVTWVSIERSALLRGRLLLASSAKALSSALATLRFPDEDDIFSCTVIAFHFDQRWLVALQRIQAEPRPGRSCQEPLWWCPSLGH